MFTHVRVSNPLNTTPTGDISTAEFRQAAQHFGLKLTLDEAASLQGRYDLDGNGMVSLAAFRKRFEHLLRKLDISGERRQEEAAEAAAERAARIAAAEAQRAGEPLLHSHFNLLLHSLLSSLTIPAQKWSELCRRHT